ncbi:hypothetical protein [Mesorhizobium sp. A623]
MAAETKVPQHTPAGPDSELTVLAVQPAAPDWCASISVSGTSKRVVCADVIALDQALIYNRFGSFNPFGMMYSLRRDVVPSDVAPQRFDADACDETDGTDETFIRDGLSTGIDKVSLTPGEVRLKDCKRPRPLVLRASVGDILHLRMSNLLRPEQPGFSETFCRQGGRNTQDRFKDGNLFNLIRNWVSDGDESELMHDEVACASGSAAQEQANPATPEFDWPRSRGLNFSIQGLTSVDASGAVTDQIEAACKGLRAVEPGAPAIDCYYQIDREGPYFMTSNAAPAGGEGDGGSIAHGLFGAVVVEQAGTSWFRSQISAGAFRKLWTPKLAGNGASPPRHAIGLANLQSPYTQYADLASAEQAKASILSMVRYRGENAFELIHSDLNAIIYRPAAGTSAAVNFREFSVFFHDELKSFFTRNFEELSRYGEGQFAGVRDGFAINYGSSGMGTLLLANRKGIGPAANCQECLYEEFFLTSWANGDPALLEQFGDDPSNIHHSYLNDQVVFRNFHAGPKETHVFHLHAHQWFAGNDPNRGTYLDSQTVAPQQGFTYNIYGGGLSVYHKGEAGKAGWYETLGSGNRNRTIGDSIFHCHLYPHFAQGMWELWRVHDVLEDGTRKLPDGQLKPGLSIEEASAADKRLKRPGSVDPQTGAWIAADAGGAARDVGTPIPAIVPLPGHAWPLLATYSGEISLSAQRNELEIPSSSAAPAQMVSMPGYPFYIGGRPGHRPPQAPNDIARATDAAGNVSDEFWDGGLPRHVLTDDAERKPTFDLPENFPQPIGEVDRKTRERQQSQVIAKALALGDMTAHLESAKIRTLPYDGSEIEKTGMAFHHNGRIDGSGVQLNLRKADGTPASFQTDQGGYPSLIGTATAGLFPVNGAPPKPGAPFADPCGAPDGFAQARATLSGGQKTYVFTKPASGGGTTDFEIMVDKRAVPSGPPATTDLIPAKDEHISNWTTWRRTDKIPDEQGELMDRPQRPKLYYIENGSVTPFPFDTAISIAEPDPFMQTAASSSIFTSDPAVVGFRRYSGSAVQLDLVTNRAGWHDPQSRINVLTANSDRYKDGAPGNNGRISPKVSSSEEPFFFRALSGECIEYRHTNELPKDLQLDDFQVKTPTDTIGQHIHLVKFDVTSSDGSGNGFNYEDGTLAADEIATRICAAKSADPTSVSANRAPGEAKIREFPGLCVADPDIPGHWKVSNTYKNRIWRLKLSEYRDLFQTTVQRWFADPILSSTREDGEGEADRTLKTVFSHDHFGPSSIQQHGFYTALVIEPQASETCTTGPEKTCTARRKDRAMVVATDIDVGTVRNIIDRDALDQENRSYREFALAVADFATLYDPRDRMTKSQLLAAFPTKASDSRPGVEVAEAAEDISGMATLVCEAKYAIVGQPGNMKRYCASVLEHDGTNWFAPAGDAPPAWAAAGKPGDSMAHRADLLSLVAADEVSALGNYLFSYRSRAAGYATDGVQLAKPVAAPRRPESISVDHHDPYLVNYRGEPIPLRLGRSSTAGSDCALKPLDHWVAALQAGVNERCSIDMQKAGPAGDMASLFQSNDHGDPVTPVMETYSSDRVLFRLVQGAQEVQHNFTLEGYNWPRDIDQRYPAGMRPLEDNSPKDTLAKACESEKLPAMSSTISRSGHADQYARWVREGAGSEKFDIADQDFWKAYEQLIANCFNAAGHIVAQEVGISEHFELAGTYRNDFAGAERARPVNMARATSDVGAINDKTPTDTLQHFGSVDSLWNGAWGLLRVYKDEKAADGREIASCVRNADLSTDAGRQATLQCFDEANKIGSRLATLEQLEHSRPEGIAIPRIKTEAIACKYDAPVVHAAAVAIEARTVFGKNLSTIGDEGTGYGKGLYDRNGLFFALVDTRAIASSSALSDDAYLSDPSRWGKVPLSRIVNAIRQTYTRPEPFVLTVNAGDCVKLTIVNALSDYAGSGGLKDDLGDAWMPRIVPLNTEPEWSGGEPYRSADLGLDPEEKNIPLRYEQLGQAQLRGSARLAVLLPLPALNFQQRIARPFGYNATGALAGVRFSTDGSGVPTQSELQHVKLAADNGLSLWKQRSGQIEQMIFYAGRVGTPNDFDIVDTLTDSAGSGSQHFVNFKARLLDLLGNPLKGGIAELGDNQVFVAPFASSQATALPVYYGGHPFQLNMLEPGAATSEELGGAIARLGGTAKRTSLQTQIEALWLGYAERTISGRLHFIPYAFGSLPIKSAGDVIGHPLHGLIGAINVAPQSASFSAGRTIIQDTRDEPLIAVGCAEAKLLDPRACTVSVVTPRPVQNGVAEAGWQTVSEVTYPEGTAAHTIREFTLFWQDGLNLRDKATFDRFMPLGSVGAPKLVADCKICDDSYDLGDEAVNYRSAPFNIRLRGEPGVVEAAEGHFDLNAYQFGPEFFALRPNEAGLGKSPQPHILRAEAGEEVVVHVIHPGGRARQRTFVTIGQDYDDLFPGFGFPHSALLGPGKAVTASLTKKMQLGCYLWHDGPTHLRAGGVWGLLDVVPNGQLDDLSVSSCARRQAAN